MCASIDSDSAEESPVKMYTTAEHVPSSLRLMSHTGVLHVRSPMTRHWSGSGTPMCNDARQLPIALPGAAHGYLCQRCKALYHKETRLKLVTRKDNA